MKTDIEIIRELMVIPNITDVDDPTLILYLSTALKALDLARLDERERLNDYLRHKEECNVSNWVDRVDVKCNCGLDDPNYKHDDLHERERMGQGWIDVKERLPEKSKRVIICRIKDGEQLVGLGYMAEDGRWYHHVTQLFDVTHWQPLPSPPDPNRTPPDLTRQIINLLGEYSQTITQDAGTTRFFALVEDNFKDVAGDIVKIWEGK